MVSCIVSYRATGLVGLLVLALHGQARAGGEEPAWRCWYNPPEHITCVIDPLSAIRPRALRHRFLHIPLHTHPFDMSGVQTLARAVVCGSRPECAMHFSAEVPALLELDRLMDPLLAAVD